MELDRLLLTGLRQFLSILRAVCIRLLAKGFLLLISSVYQQCLIVLRRIGQPHYTIIIRYRRIVVAIHIDDSQ